MLDEVTLLLVHIDQIPGFGRRKRFDLPKLQEYLAPEARSTSKRQHEKYYDTCTQTQKSSDTWKQHLVRHWLASANLRCTRLH